MTDRELLELAARVAGADHNGYRYGENGKEPLYGMPIEVDDGVEYRPWNPLTDDGDALRLAVSLKLFPQMAIMGSLVGFDEMDIFEPFSPEPQAATRRAIVRAAAELQRKKERK